MCNKLRKIPLAFWLTNENSNRDQAITLQGEERFDVLFLKYKAGGHVVKKLIFLGAQNLMQIQLTEYDDDLMLEKIIQLRLTPICQLLMNRGIVR